MSTSKKPTQDKLYRDFLKTLDRGSYTLNQFYARIENGSLWFEDNQEMSIHDPAFDGELERLTTLEIISFDREIFVPPYLAQGAENIVLDVRMSLRSERRGKWIQWYAYHKSNGILRKLYVGHSDGVTQSKLIDLAKRFQGWKNY